MPEPRLNSLLTTALEGGKLFKIRQIRPCKTRSNRMSVVESRVYVSSHGGSFPGGTGSKEPACQCRRCERHRFDPWVRKLPWRRAGQPTSVFLPGEFHELRKLVGYSPKSFKELDTTKATEHRAK